MTTETLAVYAPHELIERVALLNDLRQLDAAMRVSYYQALCESLHLNWLTRPFSYLEFQGKVVLYANKDATEQLRRINDVSIVQLERQQIHDVYVVTAYAELPSGRRDSSTGAVPIAGVKGAELANAFMKAETKAKRRVTLSICGLGLLDESELATLAGAHTLDSDAFESGNEPLEAGPTYRAYGGTPPDVTPAKTDESQWAKLVEAGAQYHITIPPFDPAWDADTRKGKYAEFSQLVIAAHQEIGDPQA